MKTLDLIGGKNLSEIRTLSKVNEVYYPSLFAIQLGRTEAVLNIHEVRRIEGKFLLTIRLV